MAKDGRRFHSSGKTMHGLPADWPKQKYPFPWGNTIISLIIGIVLGAWIW